MANKKIQRPAKDTRRDLGKLEQRILDLQTKKHARGARLCDAAAAAGDRRARGLELSCPGRPSTRRKNAGLEVSEEIEGGKRRLKVAGAVCRAADRDAKRGSAVGRRLSAGGNGNQPPLHRHDLAGHNAASGHPAIRCSTRARAEDCRSGSVLPAAMGTDVDVEGGIEERILRRAAHPACPGDSAA